MPLSKADIFNKLQEIYFVLPFFAVVMPVLVLFCGLVLDVGTLQLRRIQLQSAADAAALGAELEIEHGSSQLQIYNTTLADASLNGFANGVNGVTVSVQQRPATGPYAGNYDAIQVTVAQNVKTWFMGAINGGRTTVTTQAVVLIPPCSYLTGGNILNLYPLWGASASWSSFCPVYVNRGWVVDGFASVTSIASNIAGAQIASVVPGSTNPAPRYNAPTMADPLASIASPTYPGYCDHTLFTVAAITMTLNPGVYCGGMTLVGSTVTLNPGLYIITGGAHWTNARVTGTGVTLFFTKSLLTTYGQFRMDVNSTVNLSAPVDASAGGVPGVVIFADRNWIRTGVQDFQLDTSSFYGDGIWYTGNAGVYVWAAGTLTGPNYFGFVSDCIYFFGTTVKPLMNFSSIPGGNPFKPSGSLVQ